MALFFLAIMAFAGISSRWTSDADREWWGRATGWLIAIADRLREAKRARVGLVISCSALKRTYRDLLRSDGAAGVRFVYLAGDRALLSERLAQRRGHFMPPSLLDSQLSTLEEPSPDERAWVCDIRETPDAIVADLLRRSA